MKQMEGRRESSLRGIKRQRVSEDLLRERYEKRRKKRKRQIFVMRSALMFTLCLLLVLIILFMTPLFNVRRITVSGNNVISIEEIDSYIGDLAGENLLKVSEDDVFSRLSKLAYIKNVSVEKNYLKTTLNVYVEEREACGYIEEAGGYFLFDNEGVILAQVSDKPDKIPYVIGNTDENAKNDIKIGEPYATVLTDSLKLMRKLGILEGVDNFDITDLSDIKFTYENRLDVSCGSSIDLDRKLRLFEAMVNNNNLADKAQGSVDLSVTGNARYSPDRIKDENAEDNIGEESEKADENKDKDKIYKNSGD